MPQPWSRATHAFAAIGFSVALAGLWSVLVGARPPDAGRLHLDRPVQRVEIDPAMRGRLVESLEVVYDRRQIYRPVRCDSRPRRGDLLLLRCHPVLGAHAIGALFVARASGRSAIELWPVNRQARLHFDGRRAEWPESGLRITLRMGDPPVGGAVVQSTFEAGNADKSPVVAH